MLSIISLVLRAVSVTSLRYECVPSNSKEIGLGVANCSSQMLSHVPPNLPHNIKVLDLSNNQITELLDYSFVKYHNIEILYLKNNSLSRLEEHAFDRMNNLLYLDLSFNSLAYIPSKTFRDLPSLLTLSMIGNRINLIPQDSFVFVTKLTSLNLAGNHIQYIYPDAFTGLSQLQQLYLQNNALTKLNSSVFRYFSVSLKEIKLYNNPWYCDCNLRWLLKWLQNATTSSRQKLRWVFNTEEPTCQGPSLVEGRPLSSLSGDWFVCPIHMYSKANNKETKPGKEVKLFCKYMADPKVDIQWLKDSKLIDVSNTKKYGTLSEGETIITSWLSILNFQYEDIGEYECYAENKLGHAFDSSLVTLEGVDPSTLLHPAEISETDDKNRVRNAIIASSTIGGVVFLLVLVGVLVYAIFKCKRYHKRKKESIRMTFEEHLKANGIIEPKPKSDPQMIYDEGPDGNMSIEGEMDETESMYDSLQRPRVPSSTNTNTYISFKSEFSEPEDMTQIYTSGTKTSAAGKGSDGSQCESTSPLLENISPILIDPHDPFYEANLYVPRLDSITASYLNSTHRNHQTNHNHDEHHSYYDDDNGFLPYQPHSYTLPHNGQMTRIGSHDDAFVPIRPRTLPHGYSSRHMFDYYTPQDVPTHRGVISCHSHKSASVGHLGVSPPKKPPRLFHSRDTMSLHSQGSQSSERETGSLRLSLPKPGTVDKYGTAV